MTDLSPAERALLRALVAGQSTPLADPPYRIMLERLRTLGLVNLAQGVHWEITDTGRAAVA